jgi:hypothetical protein
MRCPFCQYEASRGDIHGHLADDHGDAVEMWTDADSGKMRYRVACPLCDEAHEARIKPRSHDPEFLKTFEHEIRLVAFDMLLNHLEAEHEALPGGEPAAARSSLPVAGPAGGRGRPGMKGVPLPPGMGEVDLPAWARLKVTQVNRERGAE